MNDADSIISAILVREGSAYTNNPVDRGGPTKFGITLAALCQYRPGSTVEDLQRLDEATAREVYWHIYVIPFLGYAEPNLGLLVDSAVQHGVARVKGWLQELPDRLNDVYAPILRRRIEFYGAIVWHDPTQAQFIKGWLNRAASFIR